MFASFLLIILSVTVSPVDADESSIHRAESWKIINYWSITCAPCRIEIPELNLLSEELAGFNVQVLGVNFDEDDRARTLEIAKRMGIEFATLTTENVNELRLQAPNVLPTTYILSPDNEVKAKLIGVQDRKTILAKLAELPIGD